MQEVSDMHIHILGICGTFMGGIAMIARQAGFKVTGCDRNVYPPMSDELGRAGISLHQGFDAEQLDMRPDLIVVGNVMKRGMPVIERMLNENLPYVSGPQWLEEHYLKHKRVLAVAGTHGKTTTSSMLTWILEKNGKNPGFLIGGIPQNFGISARNTDSSWFVIEADEYDCAFFDKRAKFVHYHPSGLIMNNLEYDHADIYENVEQIEKQFHHLVRTVPGNGLIVAPDDDAHIKAALQMGCWTPVSLAGLKEGSDFSLRSVTPDHSEFEILQHGKLKARVKFDCTGLYNARNALMACVLSGFAGVALQDAASALVDFKLPKRRMELKGRVGKVSVYDDFAHHPTAVKATLQGLRDHVGQNVRIIAVFEPRSNSMRMGANHEALCHAFDSADLSFVYSGGELKWNAEELSSEKIRVEKDFDKLIKEIVASCDQETAVLVMSNGAFGGIHQKLLDALKNHR